MTIKQVLIGAVLGSSIVGLMVHRMGKKNNLPARPHVIASSRKALHKAEPHKTASAKKSRRPWLHPKSENELSSRKLYG